MVKMTAICKNNASFQPPEGFVSPTDSALKLKCPGRFVVAEVVRIFSFGDVADRENFDQGKAFMRSKRPLFVMTPFKAGSK